MCVSWDWIPAVGQSTAPYAVHETAHNYSLNDSQSVGKTAFISFTALLIITSLNPRAMHDGIFFCHTILNC